MQERMHQRPNQPGAYFCYFLPPNLLIEQPSFIEHSKIKFAQSRWIGDYINCCDFPIGNGEAKHTKYMPAWDPDQSHFSVDQHRLYCSRNRTRCSFVDSDHNMGSSTATIPSKSLRRHVVEEGLNDPSLPMRLALGTVGAP